jgi:hypothetical protein
MSAPRALILNLLKYLILELEACDLLTQYDKGALCAVPTILEIGRSVVGTPSARAFARSVGFAHPTTT